ncbi:MAG TPA: FAD-dependent oxidoreductase [Gemmatimonadales bacterium]|nr:FAD-dependent oxidoreductase [Gemmatimonadales bacterium]
MTAGPLRVAIVGAGPSGFYAAEYIQRHADPVEIDLIDRLPTPFGLVRGGVAPDHPKIKAVTRVYEKSAAHPSFRFLGNVTVGRDLTVEELRRHYHAVIWAVGAETDRQLGIPGEGLTGSHAATEFVGWYNGHPDYRDRVFDLTQESAAVIGLGNVAMDVTRILASSPEELASTDIAPYALEALRASRVRTIYLLGRRGPVQAAFTNPELKELGELGVTDIQIDPVELELDPASAAELVDGEHREAEKNLHTMREFAARPLGGKPRRIILRFLVSPTAIEGAGCVERIVLGRNRLERDARGTIQAQPTGETESVPVGLVFRSVGYRGVAIPGLPFDERRGIIPNEAGRVLDAPGGAVLPGAYAVGWIKRGPTGVIGTNKPDAGETAERLLEDWQAGHLPAAEADRDAILRLLADRGIETVSWADWRALDAHEVAAGSTYGAPRCKVTDVAEMLAIVRKARSG